MGGHTRVKKFMKSLLYLIILKYFYIIAKYQEITIAIFLGFESLKKQPKCYQGFLPKPL